MTDVVVEPSAHLDMLDVSDWYDNELPGLGDRFLDAVERILTRIERFPESFPEVAIGVRFALAIPYPYKVFYLPLKESARVIGVFHSSRSPDIWRNRLSDEDE